MKTLTKNPDDFPKDLPLLPEPHEGKTWAYRGKGWDNDGKLATYRCSISTFWDKSDSHSIPLADTSLHYAELVDAPLDPLLLEAQAELAKQWVLEGGFERERWNQTQWSIAGDSTWTLGVKYRRKVAPTQEELDRKEAQEYAKKATLNDQTTALETAYLAALEAERNRNK